MIYENWATSEPNSASGECAVIGRNVGNGYKWVVKSCNEEFGFLCETSTVAKTDKTISITGKYSIGFMVVNIFFSRTTH